MSNLSRRKWLKTAALTTTLFAGASSASAKAFDPMPEKWDETFDVVVIGSGFAGLAAAIEARLAGASVCVLEKMRVIGGNSIINGGIMGVPGTPMQKKEGLEDSPELMAKDMMTEGGGLNQPEKVRHLCEEALPTWEWTIQTLGVEWVEERVAQEGGHSVPRCAIVKNGSGSGIVLKEAAKLEALGVKPRTRTYLERIIRDADGRVKGVQVREGYSFPKADSGKVKFIAARRAVVLCHGGFGADIKYRSIQDPKLTEKLGTTCQPGATSEAWREAARIGCQLIQTDWIQCAPWTSPVEKGMGIALFFAQGAAAMFGVWVQDKTGERFVDELANRKVRADAIMTLLNEGIHCYAVADAKGVEPMGISRPGLLQKMLERGCVKQYERSILRVFERVSRNGTAPLRAAQMHISNAMSIRRPSQWEPDLGTFRQWCLKFITAWAGSIRICRRGRSISRPMNRSQAFSLPAKRRAACTVLFASAPAPSQTAWSTAALRAAQRLKMKAGCE